jgi:hypothetical protein
MWTYLCMSYFSELESGQKLKGRGVRGGWMGLESFIGTDLWGEDYEITGVFGGMNHVNGLFVEVLLEVDGGIIDISAY